MCDDRCGVLGGPGTQDSSLYFAPYVMERSFILPCRGQTRYGPVVAQAVSHDARYGRLFVAAVLVALGLTLTSIVIHGLMPAPGLAGVVAATVVPGTVAALLLAIVISHRDPMRTALVDEVAELRKELARTADRRRESEWQLSRLSVAVEQGPNAVIITDLNGRIEYVNESFTRITGYGADEAIGRTPEILKSGETPESVYRDMWMTIGAGEVWRGVLRNRRKSGELYWDSVSISPIRDGTGAGGRYLAIQTDVTEQVTTERQLRETRNLTRAVVDSAAEGIVTLDSDGIVLTFNRAAGAIFGYSENGMAGENLRELLDRENSSDPLELPAISAESASIDLVGRRADGSRFPLEATFSEFQQDDRRLYAVILRDVTERRGMEDALRGERNFVNAVLGTSGALIVVLDRSGRVERINKACEKTTGYTIEDVCDRPFWELVPDGSEREVARQLLLGSETESFPCHFDARCGKGEAPYRMIAWHGTVIEDLEGAVAHVVLTGIDDTDRRAAEARAREREAELAHMDRLSLTGEMAAGLAHELNQPLTSIYTYAKACQRMLRDEHVSRETLGEVLAQTARRAEYTGEVIRHFRGFVRKRPPARRPVDLDRVIEEALEFVSPLICSTGITVVLELSTPHSEVWADPVQIEQVLLNLVRNAVDAMSEREATRRLTISSVGTDAGLVEVSVIDTGPGVSAERRRTLFEPFVTSKKDGLGMGLVISRGIVESHGGRLWLDEGCETGAAFRFTLPERE